MKQLFSLLLALPLLLSAHLSQGQGFPSYSPPPMPVPNNMGVNMNMYNNGPGPGYREGRGSYQLPDGSWQRASKLKFDGTTLVVKDSATGKQKFTAAGLRQFEVTRDTFLVASDLPGRDINRPEFVESQFHERGYRVWALYASAGVAFNRPHYFLKLPQAALQLLPTGKKDYKAALLAIIADCPDVARQVADGTLGRDELRETIKRYVRCRAPVGAANGLR